VIGSDEPEGIEAKIVLEDSAYQPAGEPYATSAIGGFFIPDLGAGPYATVSSEGYFSRRVLASELKGSVMLEKATDARLYSVSGRIFSDEEQIPLEALAQVVGEDGRNIGPPAQADGQGAFAVTGIAPQAGLRVKAYMPGFSVSFSEPFSLEEGGENGVYIYLQKTAASLSYSLEYRDGGSDSGSVPAPAKTYAPTASAVVLGNDGSLEKKGSSFAGWRSSFDMKAYQPGDSLVLVGDTFLTAVWELDALPSSAPPPADGPFEAGLSVEDMEGLQGPDKGDGIGEEAGKEAQEPAEGEARDSGPIGVDSQNPETGDASRVEQWTGAAVASAAFLFALQRRRAKACCARRSR
jgi:hypothetical protein